MWYNKEKRPSYPALFDLEQKCSSQWPRLKNGHDTFSGSKDLNQTIFLIEIQTRISW